MSENFGYLRLVVIKLWIFKIAKVKIVPKAPDENKKFN